MAKRKGNYNTNPLNASTVNKKVTNKLFKNLSDKAMIIVDEETQKMSNSMVYILRHRQRITGVGQFPRWDATNGGMFPNRKEPKSKKSFDKWYVKKRKNGEYWIQNNAQSVGGSKSYNYVNALLKGFKNVKGWGGGGFPRLVPNGKGVLFSSQMPNGLDPWFDRKAGEMKENIKERFFKELP